MKRLIIIGASGHGKVIADIAELLNRYEQIVFLDDDTEKNECAGFKVVGDTSVDTIKSLLEDDSINNDLIVAIGSPQIREAIQSRVEALMQESGAKSTLTTLIHPSAVIGKKVIIGAGSVVMAGAVINHGAVLGRGCIVNTCSSVDHDCVIGDFAHISVGSHLAGTVSIGDRTWVGAGAIVNNNLIICNDCMIGSGAVVIKDIIEAGTYVGVPAEKNTHEENTDFIQ